MNDPKLDEAELITSAFFLCFSLILKKIKKARFEFPYFRLVSHDYTMRETRVDGYRGRRVLSGSNKESLFGLDAVPCSN